MPTATKQGATVRISDRAHQTLRELASTSGEPMQAVLDKALEQYRRQRFWDECDAAYTALREDREEWAKYQQELALWDATLMDGLDPNEVWNADGSVTHKETGHG